jgi:glycosyltransferase involved in cell wall biosynthesis
MKKPSVTIVIPAHNESANIEYLLGDIAAQDTRAFIVKNIIVVSDGSTDETVKKAHRVKNKLIHVLDYKNRKGKVYRLNQVLRTVSTDILIQLDADTRLATPQTLHHLVQPILKNSKIGIVCGNHEPLPAKTFIESVATFGERAWSKSVDLLDNRGMLYRCCGHIRAFSKAFYRQFTLPLQAGSAEDTYSFYSAVSGGFTVVFTPRAMTQYRLPSTLYDYIKQMRRFLNEASILKKYFDQKLLEQYETMNTQTKIWAFLTMITQTNPIITASYLAIHAMAHMLPKEAAPKNGIWDVSESTKIT